MFCVIFETFFIVWALAQKSNKKNVFLKQLEFSKKWLEEKLCPSIDNTKSQFILYFDKIENAVSVAIII